MTTTFQSQADEQTAFAQLIDLQEFMDSSPTERFRQFKLVSDLLGEVIAARNEMQDVLFDSMEGDIADVPGIGVFQRVRQGKYTKWRSEELLTKIRERIWEGFRTWDEAPTTEEAIRETTATLVKLSGADRPSHGWRSGELKLLGIRAASFADYEEGSAKKVNVIA